jgi:predicted dehydrogenase
MNVIRTAILGFAHAHIDTYCSLWREKPELGIRLVAGWDHDAARAASNCQKHQLEGADSPAALLARRDVDAVIIGSETSRHAELVVQAANAGKAIVLQKPLSLTLEEADRIVDVVAKTRVPFTLAWQMRVDPHNLRMKELLAGGRFGRLYMIRRRHCLPTQNWKDFDKSWHVQPSLNHDIFADDASHPIDFMYWMLGLPRSVMAEMGTLLNPSIANDNAIALFRYADGSFAEVSCSFAASAGENTTEIVCENGVIVGNYGDLVSSMIPRPPGGIQLKWYLKETGGWTVCDLPDIVNHGTRIQGLALPLSEFLHGRRPPIATAEEGRTVLKMTLACYESAAQGRRIDFGTHSN